MKYIALLLALILTIAQAEIDPSEVNVYNPSEDYFDPYPPSKADKEFCYALTRSEFSAFLQTADEVTAFTPNTESIDNNFYKPKDFNPFKSDPESLYRHCIKEKIRINKIREWFENNKK